MVGSKRTFECVIQAEAELIPRLARRAEARACESNDKIECHGISGEALGLVIMNLTATGRDQWHCRALVQEVLNWVTWGLNAKVISLSLQSRRQPPHQNRGYEKGGRTKRWRESSKGV